MLYVAEMVCKTAKWGCETLCPTNTTVRTVFFLAHNYSLDTGGGGTMMCSVSLERVLGSTKCPSGTHVSGHRTDSCIATRHRRSLSPDDSRRGGATHESAGENTTNDGLPDRNQRDGQRAVDRTVKGGGGGDRDRRCCRWSRPLVARGACVVWCVLRDPFSLVPYQSAVHCPVHPKVSPSHGHEGAP